VRTPNLCFRCEIFSIQFSWNSYLQINICLKVGVWCGLWCMIQLKNFHGFSNIWNLFISLRSHVFKKQEFAKMFSKQDKQLCFKKYQHGFKNFINCENFTAEKTVVLCVALFNRESMFFDWFWVCFSYLYSKRMHNVYWLQAWVQISTGVRKEGGLGLKSPSWPWYFTKTLLPLQGKLVVFAYFLLVNLSIKSNTTFSILV